MTQVSANNQKHHLTCENTRAVLRACREKRPQMGRTRRSAKQAGTAFETLIANGIRDALGDSRIQRAPNWGANDKGDVVNVEIDGHPIVIQAKDVARLDLPAWTSAAKVQAVRASALAGIVIHKRRGTTDPMRQWVTCTVAELVALLTKEHPDSPTPKGFGDGCCPNEQHPKVN